MNNYNLLFISEDYPYKSNMSGIFIKQRVDYIKKVYGNIFVISPTAYFPKWATNLSYIKDYCGYTEKPRNYTYDNVKVFYPKYLPLPTSHDFFIRLRLSLGFNSVNKIIKNKNLEFDLIHAHFIENAGYIGRKLKHRYKKPLILTAHGGDVYNRPFRNKKWFEIIQKTLKFADKIITVSQRNCEILVNKLGVPYDKIRVIPNGYSQIIFKPMNEKRVRERLELPQNKKIILSIGNLKEIKGHKYLIKAMNDIIKYRRDVVCIIVGYGSTKKLNNLINEFKLDNYVKLVGGKSHEEIPLWINACDIFVLPSLNEGNPTVIAETLGCGKPVVATHVGGVPEVIKNDDLGYLIEPRNFKILAETILISLKKEWNTEKIAEYAKLNYSWEKLYRKILVIYDEVLSLA